MLPSLVDGTSGPRVATNNTVAVSTTTPPMAAQNHHFSVTDSFSAGAFNSKTVGCCAGTGALAGKGGGVVAGACWGTGAGAAVVAGAGVGVVVADCGGGITCATCLGRARKLEKRSVKSVAAEGDAQAVAA
jgi:hypothetical protein